MNRVAILALQGMEQVGQRGDANAAQELMEALEELAGQQEALNQEAGQLSQEPGADGASARMEELAGAQETMAGALGELADHPQGESVAGDLEAMAEEAREIAESLRGERIQEETLRRQEELLERLLTAGRTLERDGPTERREGTTAGPVDRPPVRALPGDLLRGTDLPLPSAEALEALSPAERRLVLDYFDRLNRGNGGSAPSPSPGGEP
jgi:cell division protein FtsL